MRDIKITIVTVCRNAEKVLEKTIQSVITQTYKNIEYIIIDGASTDETLKIIGKYKEKYPISDISEQDYGIYDAMNKGIKMATGDYIQFLNAGDSLFEVDTIQKVVDIMQVKKKDIYYGNIKYVYSDGRIESRNYSQTCSKKIYYLTGDCVNHQAIFAAKECLEGNEFDIRYQICADREWMMRMCNKGKAFKAMPITICNYSLDDESASVKNVELYKQEVIKCIREHIKKGYWIFCLFEWCRNNTVLKKILHSMYRYIYIRRQ